MTQHWLGRLFWGKQLTDEEYEDIPYPRLELHTHVMYKNCEVGTVLGALVVGPLVGLAKGRSGKAAMEYAIKGLRMGPMIMLPAAPIMTEFFIRNNEQERIYDRAFRLRHHETQLRADRWATFGEVSGVVASLALKKNLYTGACGGFLMGAVSAGIYSNVIVKKAK